MLSSGRLVVSPDMTVGDLMKVLADFAKVYENLTPTIKAQTAELVGGVYQMNILKAILKDLKNDYSVFNLYYVSLKQDY